MLSDEELIERAKQGEVHGGGQRQIQLLCERLEFYEGSARGERNVSQAKAFAELAGLRDQVQKEHWLNVHFRAFELSHAAWQFHILANAQVGSREMNSPGGAVLDDNRDLRR